MPEKRFTSLSDEALLKIWRAGEEEAMEKFLYDQYHDLVHMMALGFVKNPTDAQDICQMVWIALFNSPKTKIKNLRAWILTTTKNKCIDFQRKKWNNSVRKMDLTDFPEFSHNQNPEQLLIAQNQSETVDEIIDLLPGLQRDFFKLWLKNYSYKEIAERYNTSIRAVEGKIQRARSKMKKYEESGILKNLRGI